MRRAWLTIALCAAFLLAGCSGLRSVRRAVLYEPSEACVRAFMKQKWGFTGPYAGRVTIGSTTCYSDDTRRGMMARVECPDPPLPDCGK